MSLNPSCRQRTRTSSRTLNSSRRIAEGARAHFNSLLGMSWSAGLDHSLARPRYRFTADERTRTFTGLPPLAPEVCTRCFSLVFVSPCHQATYGVTPTRAGGYVKTADRNGWEPEGLGGRKCAHFVHTLATVITTDEFLELECHHQDRLTIEALGRSPRS